MATQKKKAPAKKETAPKKEVEPQEAQPVEKEEAPVQEETKKECKPERVITILSADDSAFLSQFKISRSSVSRAVLRGTREYLTRELLEQQSSKGKEVTEQDIVDALVGALQSKLK